MPAAPLPENEPTRLKTLEACRVLDTPADRRFDDLTRLASRLCGTPIALISLVDDDRQWFKSRIGLDAQQTPRDSAFCAHAILDDAPLVIPDATQDPRTADNPLVTGEPHIRFYAGVPLRLPTGEALGTLCVIDTRPREIDAGALGDLTALARQATAQLDLCRTNTQLRAAAEAARQADLAKSAFLANMSHEIRTPMTAILGYADLLANPRESLQPLAPPTELAEAIRQNGKHLLALLNNVLDLSRIESGEVAIATEPVSIARLTEEATFIVRSRAKLKGLSLDIRVGAVPERVMTDPLRLRQIMLNLLTNAVKFTAEGSVTMTVEHDAASNMLRVTVADTGIGMTAEQLATVRRFQPFIQADASTTRTYGGTGLGLCISQQLANQMGGAIQIDSTPEAGCTVTATVHVEPADAAGNTTQPPQDGQTGAESADDKPLLGRRILLVEDGPDNQRLIGFHLCRAGAEVEVVYHGRRACDRLLPDPDSAGFDLVLMDMQMPVMSGFEATRLLRAQGATLPIIALTASALSHDAAACLEAGCDRHLAKPYQRGSLVQACAEAIARPRRHGRHDAA